MLTEYKIKLDEGGLTITQRLDPGISQPLPAFAADNALQASYDQSKSANAQSKGSNAASPSKGGSSAEGPGDSPGGGGFTGSGAAPITIIGPNILMCCPCSQAHKETQKENTKP